MDYLTAKEACEKYKVNRSTLYRWVDTGKMYQVKDPETGRVRFIPFHSGKTMTIKETCSFLEISRTHLYRLLNKGKIKPIPGFSTLFDEEDLFRYKQARHNSFILVPHKNKGITR